MWNGIQWNERKKYVNIRNHFRNVSLPVEKIEEEEVENFHCVQREQYENQL